MGFAFIGFYTSFMLSEKFFFFFNFFICLCFFFIYIYIYIYCVDVENCRSFKSFSYIYIYIDYVSLVGIIRSFSIKKDRRLCFFVIIMFACHDFSETALLAVSTPLTDDA